MGAIERELLVKANSIHKNSIECTHLSYIIEELISIIIFKMYATHHMSTDAFNASDDINNKCAGCCALCISLA